VLVDVIQTGARTKIFRASKNKFRLLIGCWLLFGQSRAAFYDLFFHFFKPFLEILKAFKNTFIFVLLLQMKEYENNYEKYG